VIRRANVFVVVTVSLLVSAVRVKADCRDPFGKPNEVLDFHVKMSRADWNKLLADRIRNVDGLPPNSPACMDQFTEFPAEFRCADEPWIKMAIRKKKGTERGVEAPLKPPLKLDFNEDFMGQQPTAKGQRWPANMGELGFRKLTLNNGQGNKPAGRTLILPILLSEHVALRLLHRELPQSPATAYAKVTFHFEDKPEGEYHGVYVLVEDIDRTAIRRRWGRADGRLTKMSKDNCSPEAEYDDGPPNESFTNFNTWLNKNPGTGAAWMDESSKVVELDALLRQEAIREILVNGDDTISYVTTSAFMKEGNNFYAFDPRQGPRQYMPWDVDLTFGQQNENCAPTNLMCRPTEALFRWCGATQSRVGRATVCHTSAIQKRYLEIMCQLTQGTMSAGEIVKVWDEADRAVRPVVPLEKDLIWNGQDPLATGTSKSYGAEYARIKQWIPERIRSVQQQITMRGVPCNGGCTATAPEACSYLGCPGERRCEGGLWSPCRPTSECRPVAPGDGGVAPGVDGGSGSGGAGGGMGTGGAPATGGAGGGAGGGNAGGAAGSGASPVGGASGGGAGSGAGGSGAGTGGGAGGRAGSGSGTTAGAGGQPGGPGGGQEPGGCQCRLDAHAGAPAGGGLPALALLIGVGLLPRWRRRRARPSAN